MRVSNFSALRLKWGECPKFKAILDYKMRFPISKTKTTTKTTTGSEQGICGGHCKEEGVPGT
jgi:hypothetical protein